MSAHCGLGTDARDSGFRRRSSPGLIQLAQKLGEIALARLGGRRLEGTAERGGNAGMCGWNVHTDDPAIHVHFRRLRLLLFCNHMGETMAGELSFVRFDMTTAQIDQ